MAIKFSMPSHYDSITLKQFVAYKSAKSDLEKLQAVTTLTKEQAAELPLQHLPQLLGEFEAVLANESAKFFQTITIKDKDFGFIPDLYQISAGEYADISTWSADINTNIIKIMSVLYRPIDKRVGDKYTIQKYSIENRMFNEVYIEQMTLEQFNGAMLFFSTLLSELKNTSLDYLENEVQRLTKELQQNTQE